MAWIHRYEPGEHAKMDGSTFINLSVSSFCQSNCKSRSADSTPMSTTAFCPISTISFHASWQFPVNSISYRPENNPSKENILKLPWQESLCQYGSSCQSVPCIHPHLSAIKQKPSSFLKQLFFQNLNLLTSIVKQWLDSSTKVMKRYEKRMKSVSGTKKRINRFSCARLSLIYVCPAQRIIREIIINLNQIGSSQCGISPCIYIITSKHQ